MHFLAAGAGPTHHHSLSERFKMGLTNLLFCAISLDCYAIFPYCPAMFSYHYAMFSCHYAKFYYCAAPTMLCSAITMLYFRHWMLSKK